MATISFSFRSTKDISSLEIRFTYYDEGNKRKSFYSRTQGLEVSKEFWGEYKSDKRFRDVEKLNLKDEVDSHLRELKAYLDNEASKVDAFTKEWFKRIVDKYYNPVEPDKPENYIPIDYVGLTDYYIETKKNEISESKRKKLTTTKNKIIRMQEELGYIVLIAEINERFKTDYINYSNKHRYSQNTQQRELVRIKALCRYAKYLGLETHHQLDGLRIKRQAVNHIYLNFDELETIKNHQFDKNYLDNARDWLIISCYSGQRVSDFMRFNTDMIREEGGKRLLEFKQKKTQKLMTIPVLKEVDEVLNKRDGHFPRPISAQKYNDYIKEVCKACEIDEMSKGKVRECIYPDKPKNERTPYDYRDVTGEYPKYELVTSHIGRRSFATNYYGKVPTTFLKEITGHSTEKMFLNYIKKSNKDLALDAFDYFNGK